MKTKINNIKSFEVYMAQAKENYEKILTQSEEEQNEIISPRFVDALSNHLANTKNCPVEFKGKPNRLKAFFGTQQHYKKILLNECYESETFQEGFLWSMYLENRAERIAFNQEPYSSFQAYLDNNYFWLVRAYERELKRNFKN